MDPRYDIKTLNGELVFKNNDLVWDVSDQQHIQDTINSAQGWWKENFSDGVNIRAYLNSDKSQFQILARAIKINLESDLYIVENPNISLDSSGKLVIQPNANIL
jgi:hypothetical protein